MLRLPGDTRYCPSILLPSRNRAKTFIFTDAGSGPKLEIQGFEHNAVGTFDGCQHSGLALECTASDTTSPWHNYGSERSTWTAKGSDTVNGLSSATLSTPCETTSGFSLTGHTNNHIEIWPSNGLRYAVFEGSPYVDVAAACTSGTVMTSGDYTFCYGSKGKTYDQANTFCQSAGLALVEPRTVDLDAAVTAVCDYDCTWLGLTCTTQDSTCDTGYGGWSWATSGASLASGTSHFSMSSDGTINGGGTTEYCAHFWHTTPSWGPQTCSSTYYGALCVDPAVNANQ